MKGTVVRLKLFSACVSFFASGLWLLGVHKLVFTCMPLVCYALYITIVWCLSFSILVSSHLGNVS